MKKTFTLFTLALLLLLSLRGFAADYIGYTEFDSKTGILRFKSAATVPSSSGTITVHKFGTSNSSYNHSFNSDKYADQIVEAIFDASFKNATECDYARTWFKGLKNLKRVWGWNYVKTSTDRNNKWEEMFMNCTSLEDLGDFSNLGSMYVSTCKNMFAGCTSLKRVDFSNRNFSKVDDFERMFYNCTGLEEVNFAGASIAGVTDFDYMFYNCQNLRMVYFDECTTTNLTYTQHTFDGCKNLLAIFVGSGFTVAKVSKSGYMFNDCTKLKGYPNGVSFSTSNQTDKSMATTSKYLSTPSTQDKGYVYYFNNTFYICYDKHCLPYSVHTNCWEASNTGTSKPGWLSYSLLATKAVVDFNARSFKPKSTAYWFYDCKNLTELENFDSWMNLSDVTTTAYMFSGCTKLQEIKVGNYSTTNLTDMSHMFDGCTALTRVSLPNAVKNSPECKMNHMFNNCSKLSAFPSFGTYVNPSNMSHMFDGCTGLSGAKILAATTTNCTDMSYMFNNCSNITSLEFKCSMKSVTTAEDMFANCSNLQTLYLKNTSDKTTALTNTKRMFYNDSKLKRIYVQKYGSDLYVGKVTNTNSYMMFYGCTSLVGGKGTKYQASYDGSTYARIDEGSSSKGYFTPAYATLIKKDNNSTIDEGGYSAGSSVAIANLTKTGYTFLGWTCSGGYTLTTPKTDLTIPSLEAAYPITCTAHWAIDVATNKDFKVYLAQNGSTNAPYNGNERKIAVVDGSKTLTQGTHYTISQASVKDAGTYSIKVEGIEKGGYVGTKTTTIVITKASLTLTVDNKEKTYGASDPTLTYKLNGVFGNDVVTPSISRTSGNNVGKYTITATVAESTNYKSASATGTFTIKAKPITVTPSGTMIKTYGDADPAFTYTASGLVGNDQLSGTLKRAAGENVGTYDFDPTSLNNNNYAISFNNTKFTIKPKNITVTPDAISKTYGDPDPVITYTTDGLVNSDKLSGNLTRKSGENVGSYDIINNLSNDNYNILLTSSVKFNITQKTVMAPTVVLDSKVAVFTGSEITPAVKLLDGETEIPSSEYIVSYSDNIQKSDQAKVIITNKNGGNYVVSNVVETFEIVDQDQAYKVTYITNGHGPENKVVYAVKNATMILPPDMIAEGYSLEGMYTDADFTAGSKWDYDNDVVNSDITLYANWTINKYTIKYYVDGATTATQTDEYDFGATVTPYNNHLTGCTIVWDKEIPSVMPAQNLEIHGDNITNKHNLIYLLDGIEYSKETIAFGTTLTIKPAPSAREGYSFSGWSTLPSTMPDNDVTITGTFDANKHTITFTINSETIQTTNTEFGADIASLLPKKPGFRFVPANDIPTTMPDKDLTIAGSWQERTYRLTYKIDGEEHQHFDLNYGVAITPLAAPTKTGYTFSGWSNIPATMPDDDITITGSFKANEHTITYMVDGKVYKTTKATFGSKITAPTMPYKSGVKFSGWSNVPETMPDKDITITGSYTSTTPVAEITESEDIKVWSYNRTIYIETAPDTKYTIVDLNGRMLTTSTTQSTHDEIQINQTGVIIVIINNRSFKLFN